MGIAASMINGKLIWQKQRRRNVVGEWNIWKLNTCSNNLAIERQKVNIQFDQTIQSPKNKSI